LLIRIKNTILKYIVIVSQHHFKNTNMSKLEKKVIDDLYNREERENFEGIKINDHKIPDPKLHQQISFAKSGIRILGYVALCYSLDIAVGLLILSEGLGIIEELV
jgi:hypothetical protein